MLSPLEVVTDEVNAMAKSAREAIDARLQILSQGAADDFWLAVSKLYARGLGGAPPVLDEPAP